MSKIGLVALLVLVSVKSFAQQDYFVLIQSDNNQPFYARIGESTLSSSAKGHLILSQLKDSTYILVIGFPKKLYPEQQFSFAIKDKDLELELKDLGDRGWGLLDLQTQELKTADKREEPNSHPEGVKKDDAFSRLMAGVVGDTVVMYNTYAKTESLKDNPVTVANPIPGIVDSQKVAPAADRGSAVAIGDSSKQVVASSLPVPGNTDILKAPPLIATDSPLEKKDSSKQIPASDTVTSIGRGDSSKAVASIPLYKASTVRKLSERRTAKAIRLVYADHTQGRKSDTVVVIIPLDTGIQIAQNQTDTGKNRLNPNIVAENGARADQPPGMSSIQPAGVVSEPVTAAKADSSQKKGRAKPVLVNSDCKDFATGYDVDKLRVKMLEAGKDDDRILVARKIFRSKCFTTKQIRALSEVFTSDALRFKFFETAYPFVSDDHFKELTDLLVDPVYNNKFRAMTSPK